jgi:hypothetical protein
MFLLSLASESENTHPIPDDADDDPNCRRSSSRQKESEKEMMIISVCTSARISGVLGMHRCTCQIDANLSPFEFVLIPTGGLRNTLRRPPRLLALGLGSRSSSRHQNVPAKGEVSNCRGTCLLGSTWPLTHSRARPSSSSSTAHHSSDDSKQVKIFSSCKRTLCRPNGRIRSELIFFESSQILFQTLAT